MSRPPDESVGEGMVPQNLIGLDYPNLFDLTFSGSAANVSLIAKPLASTMKAADLEACVPTRDAVNRCVSRYFQFGEMQDLNRNVSETNSWSEYCDDPAFKTISPYGKSMSFDELKYQRDAGSNAFPDLQTQINDLIATYHDQQEPGERYAGQERDVDTAILELTGTLNVANLLPVLACEPLLSPSTTCSSTIGIDQYSALTAQTSATDNPAQCGLTNSLVDASSLASGWTPPTLPVIAQAEPSFRTSQRPERGNNLSNLPNPPNPSRNNPSSTHLEGQARVGLGQKLRQGRSLAEPISRFAQRRDRMFNKLYNQVSGLISEEDLTKLNFTDRQQKILRQRMQSFWSDQDKAKPNFASQRNERYRTDGRHIPEEKDRHRSVWPSGCSLIVETKEYSDGTSHTVETYRPRKRELEDGELDEYEDRGDNKRSRIIIEEKRPVQTLAAKDQSHQALLTYRPNDFSVRK